MSSFPSGCVRPCVLIALAWLCVPTANADILHLSCDTVIFCDDFSLPDYSPPDPNKWIINHPDALPPLNPHWWVQGRSHFPEPSTPGAKLPYILDGRCVIEHHLYNNLDTNHTTFIGGEISTRTHYSFPATQAYLFEARVRCGVSEPPEGNGLVSSFFVYGYDGAKSDEIDFEFLSNETNAHSPNHDAVHLATWNESEQTWVQQSPDGLDLTTWNTFRIYWYPQEPRVIWTWLDPLNDNAEVDLYTETNPFYMPDESMDLYFNFWAATDAWTKAYASPPEPVSDPDLNQIFKYEIEYVKVCVPEPATSSSILIAAICGAICMFRKGMRR